LTRVYEKALTESKPCDIQDPITAENGLRRQRTFLAAVNSSVVGISHRFKESADPCGKRLRTLATILNNTNLKEGEMLTVQLERVLNLDADANAVSVIVHGDAPQGCIRPVVDRG
jgi:hypothetical protein